MLKKLQINNFQSWRDGKFEFSPRTNFFIGPSDSGKSAVVRALEWVKNNRPLGDGNRRTGTKKPFSAKLVSGENTFEIERKLKTQYKFNGEELNAVGKSVPEEISVPLNLSDINIQGQHDNYFLLSKSPGEVAKYLNKIVNLEQIDSTMLHANRRISGIDGEIVTVNKAIAALKTELESYEWVDEADRELSDLEELEKGITESTKSATGLKMLLDSMSNDVLSLESFDKILSHEQKTDDLIALSQHIKTLGKGWYDISKLVVAIETEQSFIHDFDKIITAEKTVGDLIDGSNILDAYRKSRMGLHGILESISDDEIKIGRYNDILCTELEVNDLLILEDESNKADKEYCSLDTVLNKIREELHDIDNFSDTLLSLQDKYKELMGDVCPLCDRVLPK